MKKLFILILAVIAGCAGDKLEIPKAKKVVENLIVAIDKGDYAAINNYYSPDFNAGEPVEDRTKKLEALKKVMGDMQSYQLIDSVNEAVAGEDSRILLKYRIHHTRATSIETFNVVYEEGGYRVSGHDVKTDNLPLRRILSILRLNRLSQYLKKNK